jgi:hypothetical protein
VKRPTPGRRSIVVEGTGEVVVRFYVQALKSHSLEGGVPVTFIWDSRFSANRPEYREKIATIQSKLKWSEKVKIFDRATDEEQIKLLNPDLVFICTPSNTHSDIAQFWLRGSRARRTTPLLSIEKPIDSSLDGARRLLAQTLPEERRVFVADHYWTRSDLDRTQFDLLRHGMGVSRKKTWLRELTFYFLEDHSGNDRTFIEQNPTLNSKRHGPIEIENRVETLREGLVLDMLPHALAFLGRFGIPGTLRLTSLAVGRYTGVDGDPAKQTEIDSETFAAIRFWFQELYTGRPAVAKVFLGKGVGGMRSVPSCRGGPERHSGEVKMATLAGPGGERAVFDFKGILSKEGMPKLYVYDDKNRESTTDLIRDPSIVSRLLAPGGGDDASPYGVSLEHSKRFLEVIEDIRFHVRSAQRIPTYPLGPPGGKTPQLEKILDQLPSIVEPPRRFGRSGGFGR